jgi:hypothetical protein
LNPIRAESRSSFPETMGRAGTTQAQRRSDAAPLALALAGWVLAVAPIAHPLLAHGTPFLRTALDDGWVHHPGERRSPGPSAPPEHHHAPGAPEHLQLPLLAAVTPPAFETVLLAWRVPIQIPHRKLSLPRRWSQEQPQAP